jgi:S-DNA-T family DNA segregation ATPase FtsK/SpoIIIE
MERRFDVLSQWGSKNIEEYNKSHSNKENFEKLPYIVLIIDELADLMAARGREMEAAIVRLAQMSRAVGIHLILATQRPSVEVITGLIKANITSRITFQVASQTDSRTVLDMGGAEKLLGSGDLLFISAEKVKPRRIQGAYVSEKEVKRVVKYVTSNSSLDEEGDVKDISDEVDSAPPSSLNDALESGRSLEEDPLFEEAKRLVIESKKASASLLQRRLRVGYARAARLIDFLEERGVVGPGEGAKPRKVFVDEGEDQEY